MDSSRVQNIRAGCIDRQCRTCRNQQVKRIATVGKAVGCNPPCASVIDALQQSTLADEVRRTRARRIEEERLQELSCVSRHALPARTTVGAPKCAAPRFRATAERAGEDKRWIMRVDGNT